MIVANTFAYVISRGLQPIPIFDLLTRQDGLELPSMEELREEDILRVEDAMQPVEGPVLDAEETVEKALQHVDGSTRRRFAGTSEPERVEYGDEGSPASDGGGGKASAKLGPLLLVRAFLICIRTFRWRRHCGISSDGRWFRW